jgi:hypothetical protein
MTMSPVGVDDLRAVGAQVRADLGDAIALDEDVGLGQLAQLSSWVSTMPPLIRMRSAIRSTPPCVELGLWISEMRCHFREVALGAQREPPPRAAWRG